MKREGNKVLFDNERQHEAFRETLMQARGADVIIDGLLKVIGQARRDEAKWWGEIRGLAKLADDEYVVYDWQTESLTIHKKVIPETYDSIDG